METRSKAQRDAVGADAMGSGSVIGETEIRSARDPSPPVLSPVGIRTTPVPSEGSLVDAEQHQEHTDIRHRSGSLTLEPITVRIDPGESVMVRPVASGPLVSSDKQHSFSEYKNVDTVVSLSAAASVVGTGSVSGMSQADADDEVASYMTLKSPGPFRGSPSWASRIGPCPASRFTLSPVIHLWN